MHLPRSLASKTRHVMGPAPQDPPAALSKGSCQFHSHRALNAPLWHREWPQVPGTADINPGRPCSKRQV